MAAAFVAAVADSAAAASTGVEAFAAFTAAEVSEGFTAAVYARHMSIADTSIAAAVSVRRRFIGAADIIASAGMVSIATPITGLSSTGGTSTTGATSRLPTMAIIRGTTGPIVPAEWSGPIGVRAGSAGLRIGTAITTGTSATGKQDAC